MGKSTCRFSGTRFGKPTPRKVRGFLSLPGELRNQIYQYYFESESRCEVAAHGQQFEQRKTRTVKLWPGASYSNAQVFKYDCEVEGNGPVTIRISRPFGRYNTIKGLQTNWLASLYALNLVCKQVHVETLSFLYHKTDFVFAAPKRITNFLAVLPKSKLENITKLQLYYTTYGCPKLTKDRIWQDKHNESWMRACQAAAKKLTGLRALKIWITVNESPLRLNLREKWVFPLLQFRRLTCGPNLADDSLISTKSEQAQRGLESVDIHFRTRLSGSHFNGNQGLAKANEDLHRLFGQAIRLAILGAKEEKAMSGFNDAWTGKYEHWQHHLNFAQTG